MSRGPRYAAPLVLLVLLAVVLAASLADPAGPVGWRSSGGAPGEIADTSRDASSSLRPRAAGSEHLPTRRSGGR